MATSAVILKKCFICNKKCSNDQLKDASKCLDSKTPILVCDTCHEKNILSDDAIFASRVVIGFYITDVFRNTSYAKNYYRRSNGYYGQIGTSLIRTPAITIYNTFDTKFMTYTFLKNRVLKKLERKNNRIIIGRKNISNIGEKEISYESCREANFHKEGLYPNFNKVDLLFDIKCMFLNETDNIPLRYFCFKYIVDSKNRRRIKQL